MRLSVLTVPADRGALTFALWHAGEGAQRRSASVAHQRVVSFHLASLIRMRCFMKHAVISIMNSASVSGTASSCFT